jgi:GMP synthase-like glutamine amidotransferase
LKILIVQNSRCAPAGVLGESLAEAGADLVTVTPDEGEALPSGPDGYDGALILGGPQSAADDGTSPYIPELLHLMRGFAQADRPLLGVCLGAQLLARTHGERVYRHSIPERGFKPVTLTEAGATDPLLSALGPERPIMQWHYDTFDLPRDAVLLATGPDCANQAFRIGRAQYGVQFHPEVTDAIVRDWAARFRHEAGPADDFESLALHLEAQMREHLAGANSFARELACRWMALM